MPDLPEPTQIMGDGGWVPLSVERMQEVLPQYEVIEMLGRGGMGAVYKARQRSLNRLVAIKILPLGLANDEFQFAERFRNEAQTMAQMNHPAIVNVYDFGETPEGLLYFVMEYVDGTDVHQMIKASGKLSGEHALAIAAHVCDALTSAHQRGIIHRDIKPANILINQEGQVKVADFGLAKMHDPAQTSGLTRTNMAMGTPDYAAPEVFAPGVTADHRADLYAVGVMLYQMLTGEVPRGMFKLPSQKGLGSDPRFDAIIIKAMEVNRDERFQSALEVRHALDEILTTPLPKDAGTGAVSKSALPPRPRVAPNPQTGQPQSSPSKSKWLIAGAVVALLGVAGFFVWSAKKKPSVAATAASNFQSQPTAIPASPLPSAPVNARAVDLLPLVDVKRDAITGEWRRDGNDLVVKAAKPDAKGNPRLQLPYQPPEEYDFEIEFTPESGTNMVGQVLSGYQHSFAWLLDAQLTAGSKAGFNQIDGVSLANRTDGTTMRTKFLTNGQRHRSTIEVRRNRVRAMLDGEPLVTWGASPKSYERLEAWRGEKLRDALHLGLIAYDRAVRFHKATVREISGAGKMDANSVAATPSEPPAQPNITTWQDVTGTVMDQAKAKPGFTFEGDLIAWTGDKMNPPHFTVTPAGRNDYAIRLKHVGAGQINVRMNEKGFVYLQAAPAGLRINRWMKGVVVPVSLIASQPIPFSYDKGEPHDLTVTVQGSTIRAWLDGQLMGTVEDTTFAEGTGAVALVSYGKVQKVEIAALVEK